MANRNPIGIYHKANEIVFFGRRKNGKDLPGTRWATIKSPAQRALIERVPLDELRYQGGSVKLRTKANLAARKAAAKRAQDVAWLNGERQKALIEALIDELGGGTDFATVEASYLNRLSN